MTHLVQTLTEIRDDLASSRNAYLVPINGDATATEFFRKQAQAKVDALNTAILIIDGIGNEADAV